MSPNVDPRKSSQRDRSFFDGFSPGDWLNKLGRILRWLFYLLVVGLVLYVGYDFHNFVRTAPELQANVVVEGNQAVAGERIENVVLDGSGVKGDSPTIFAFSPDRVAERLRDRISRFSEVEVWKLPPRTLKIKVVEREPIALVAVGKDEAGERRFKPADREGVVFGVQPGEQKRLRTDQPPVLGLENLDPASKKFRRHWSRFLKARRAFDEVFDERMVGFYKFQPGGGLLIQLARPRRLEVHLGRGDFERKVEELYEIMATEEFHQIEEYVDLSNPGDIRVQ